LFAAVIAAVKPPAPVPTTMTSVSSAKVVPSSLISSGANT
jgi:hypothetical protein